MAVEFDYILKTEYKIENSFDFCYIWDVTWAPRLLQYAINVELIEQEAKISEMESSTILIDF